MLLPMFRAPRTHVARVFEELTYSPVAFRVRHFRLRAKQLDDEDERDPFPEARPSKGQAQL
jgi:hypothetical protein